MNSEKEAASQKIRDFVHDFRLYQVWLRNAIISIDTSFPKLKVLPRDRKVAVLPYVIERPYKFFDLVTYQQISGILSTVAQTGAINLPANYEGNLQRALNLLRVTNQTNNEYSIDYNKHPEIVQEELRTIVFVEYARLAEYILVELVRPLLYVFFRQRGLPDAHLATEQHRTVINQAHKHLKISKVYNPAVRNAIAHGSIDFDEGNRTVKFTADNGECVEMSLDDAASLADNLLDVCNGIAVAIFEAEACGLILQNSPLAIQNRSIALMQTAFLKPHTYYIKQRHDGLQLTIHGTCRHWNVEEFMIDSMRSLIIAKNNHPHVKYFFVDYRDSRDIPFFFSVEAIDIPEYGSEVRELGKLHKVMARSGFVKIVPARALVRLIGKMSNLAFPFNWANEVDRAFDPKGESPSYEVRRIKNISAGWHSRFEANVISIPRAVDLDDTGSPTREYLQYIFTQTIIRWTIRDIPDRSIEPKIAKVFKTAIIFVYQEDRRLSAFYREGVSENMLFRFECSLWSPLISIPLLGEGTLERPGHFIVSVNPLARNKLQRIRQGDSI